MRSDDRAALMAKAVIEMYCYAHDCSQSCIFYSKKDRCCGLSDAVHYWETLPEEE